MAELIADAIEADMRALMAAPTTRGSVLDGADFPNLSVAAVFWLNAGLSLENLLKGIIVLRNPEIVDGDKLTKKLSHHNLNRLALEAGVAINVVDAFYLQVASGCIAWAGRYPIAKTPTFHPQPVSSESDHLAYQSLFARLKAEFPASVRRSITYERLV